VGGAQVHVIYAYPSDAADNFGRWVTPIARDMATIDTWWTQQDPTRTLRFDVAGFPGCDSVFGRLDVSSVRLPSPAATYAGGEEMLLDHLARDLRGTFASAHKKYLVYFDGPVASGSICGRGQPVASEGASAVVYLQSQIGCQGIGGGIGATGGGFPAFVAAHEMIHALDEGLPTGPHACPDEQRHYCDDPNDIMRPSADARTRLSNAVLDAAHDDYYGNGGPGWDLRTSVFLAHLDVPQVRLSVAVGAPGGSVTSNLPGIACPGVCDLPWDAGTDVALSARSEPGYAFAGWGGACTGPLPSCALTLGADTAVTARFGRVGELTVRVVGHGAVDACASRCVRPIVEGQQILLKASPRGESEFLRWDGACRGKQRECTIAAVPGATVRAVFADA
jgi:hypothetical protein